MKENGYSQKFWIEIQSVTRLLEINRTVNIHQPSNIIHGNLSYRLNYQYIKTQEQRVLLQQCLKQPKMEKNLLP